MTTPLVHSQLLCNRLFSAAVPWLLSTDGARSWRLARPWPCDPTLAQFARGSGSPGAVITPASDNAVVTWNWVAQTVGSGNGNVPYVTDANGATWTADQRRPGCSRLISARVSAKSAPLVPSTAAPIGLICLRGIPRTAYFIRNDIPTGGAFILTPEVPSGSGVPMVGVGPVPRHCREVCRTAISFRPDHGTLRFLRPMTPRSPGTRSARSGSAPLIFAMATAVSGRWSTIPLPHCSPAIRAVVSIITEHYTDHRRAELSLTSGSGSALPLRFTR